jgi:hypothetical protein
LHYFENNALRTIKAKIKKPGTLDLGKIEKRILFLEVVLLVDRTFKFSLAERLNLGSVLPKEVDIITVWVLLKLREEVFLTSEEIEKFEVKASAGGNVAWNEEDAKLSRQYVWDNAKRVESKKPSKISTHNTSCDWICCRSMRPS